jgi:hypothetical protein
VNSRFHYFVRLSLTRADIDRGARNFQTRHDRGR